MRLHGCAAAITLALLAAGCSSNASSATAPSTTARRGAQVRTFTVPAAVECGHATSAAVTVDYAISGARRWQVMVDGLPGTTHTTPSGRISVHVHCDGVQHTIALVATDAHGLRTSAVRYLTTRLSSG